MYIHLAFSYIYRMKSDVLTIRIDKAQKQKLSKAAQISKRNMSDYLRLLLEYAIENQIKL